MRAAYEDEGEPMIQGTKTRLRALEHDDLKHFVAWVSDPEIRRYLAIRYPLSMTEEETWWQGHLQRKNDYVFAIETEDGTYIGTIGLHDLEPENRQAMLGIAIGDRDYWGRGYGTDAILALLGLAFGYLNLNRVYLRVYAYNERAIRCYQKCGFQHEGTMRQARYSDGQYYDEWIMGILRDELVADSRRNGAWMRA
jgi:RimJ/RimL family protein N-acetyltransferase